MLQRFTALYPVWIVASSVMALFWPDTLRWFSGPWVVWALTIVMLSMGLTLTVDDFRRLVGHNYELERRRHQFGARAVGTFQAPLVEAAR